jgi:hypothetical protein
VLGNLGGMVTGSQDVPMTRVDYLAHLEGLKEHGSFDDAVRDDDFKDKRDISESSEKTRDRRTRNGCRRLSTVASSKTIDYLVPIPAGRRRRSRMGRTFMTLKDR